MKLNDLSAANEVGMCYVVDAFFVVFATQCTTVYIAVHRAERSELL